MHRCRVRVRVRVRVLPARRPQCRPSPEAGLPGRGSSVTRLHRDRGASGRPSLGRLGGWFRRPLTRSARAWAGPGPTRSTTLAPSNHQVAGSRVTRGTHPGCAGHPRQPGGTADVLPGARRDRRSRDTPDRAPSRVIPGARSGAGRGTTSCGGGVGVSPDRSIGGSGAGWGVRPGGGRRPVRGVSEGSSRSTIRPVSRYVERVPHKSRVRSAIRAPKESVGGSDSPDQTG